MLLMSAYRWWMNCHLCKKKTSPEADSALAVEVGVGALGIEEAVVGFQVAEVEVVASLVAGMIVVDVVEEVVVTDGERRSRLSGCIRIYRLILL